MRKVAEFTSIYLFLTALLFGIRWTYLEYGISPFLFFVTIPMSFAIMEEEVKK